VNGVSEIDGFRGRGENGGHILKYELFGHYDSHYWRDRSGVRFFGVSISL